MTREAEPPAKFIKALRRSSHQAPPSLGQGPVDQTDLPKNIQGQVSSAIARDLSCEAFLAIPPAPASILQFAVMTLEIGASGLQLIANVKFCSYRRLANT